MQSKAAALKPGRVLAAENIRFHLEEEGKPKLADDASEDERRLQAEMKESKKFSKTLASLADVYVNDAFGTAHRAHASTAIIADYFDADNKMFSYLIESEGKPRQSY